MDELAGLLDGAHARGAFVLRTRFHPPWAVRIEDRSPLAVIAVVRGGAWLRADDGEPVEVPEGGVALVKGPEPYTFADDPATPPQSRTGPDQVCRPVPGEEERAPEPLGVRSWGHAGGTTVALIGVYESPAEVSRRLVDALPSISVVPGGPWSAPLVDLLAAEAGREGLGQDVVLDRLLDVLAVAAVREWCGQAGDRAPSWLRAHADAVAGPALRLLQDAPERDWTVASLADAVHVSRATLARRFAAVVGEPPMTYLASWRLALAADLLREPGATLGSVAPRVGYATPFALSAAFKRVRGMSPATHRAAAS